MYGLTNPFQRKKNHKFGTILHRPGMLDAKICSLTSIFSRK